MGSSWSQTKWSQIKWSQTEWLWDPNRKAHYCRYSKGEQIFLYYSDGTKYQWLRSMAPPNSYSWQLVNSIASEAQKSSYQWQVGDPGDKLRAPGDSDNNGGQKDGDNVGEHENSFSQNSGTERYSNARDSNIRYSYREGEWVDNSRYNVPAHLLSSNAYDVETLQATARLQPTDRIGSMPSLQQPSSACDSCRKRKRKCDKRLPGCSHCARNYLTCHYPCLLVQNRDEISQGQQVTRPSSSAAYLYPNMDAFSTGPQTPHYHTEFQYKQTTSLAPSFPNPTYTYSQPLKRTMSSSARYLNYHLTSSANGNANYCHCQQCTSRLIVD